MQIDFGADQLELSVIEQDEGWKTISQSCLEMFDGEFLQWIGGQMLNPFVHLLFVELAVVDLPIP